MFYDAETRSLSEQPLASVEQTRAGKEAPGRLSSEPRITSPRTSRRLDVTP